MGKVDVVVGGQFGSEGKGLIVGEIAKDYDIHVRVGASNAGHTAYVNGEKHVVQAIPVAAYAAPEAICVIGAGAIVSDDILLSEIERNRQWRRTNKLPPLRLVIDHRAHIVMPSHKWREEESDLVERIGSTSATAREGIGAASAARLMRDATCTLADEHDELAKYIDDTVSLLHTYIDLDRNVLLEGTQGTDLSITTGYFPYVTSRNPTAAGIAADCGIGPKDINDIICVFRTFPIRVAGNSGPFGPGSIEIDFDRLGVKEERTTVTKKVRRIATFSTIQAQQAADINSATQIAVTFTDYMAKSLAGQTGFESVDPESDSGIGRVAMLVDMLEAATGKPVTFLGTGPESVIDLREYDNKARLKAIFDATVESRDQQFQ